jgi:putative transposase
MAKNPNNQVQAFLLWPIEQAISYLFVGVSYCKIWGGARYVTKAILVVAGVREVTSQIFCNLPMLCLLA